MKNDEIRKAQKIDELKKDRRPPIKKTYPECGGTALALRS